MRRAATLLLLLLLLPLTASAQRWTAVVDARYAGADGAREHGTPTYHTLGAALAHLAGTARAMVFLRNGRYAEKLAVVRPAVTLVGESRDGVVVTWGDASGTPRPNGTGTLGTFGSYTLRVGAPDFRAEHLTIENAFDYVANMRKANDDPTKLQGAQAVALALDSASDRAVFDDVRITGHQDTLYPNAGRVYFHRCEITGSVDFIFGAARAVFDDCDIVSRDRFSANNGYIAAPSTPLRNAYGFLFVHSRLKKESPSMAANSVVLGRPWHSGGDPQAVGSAVFVDCWMDDHVGEKGWDRMRMGSDSAGNPIWAEPSASRFYEYHNSGPGSVSSPRRPQLSDADATRYTIARVLDGWAPTVARH